MKQRALLEKVCGLVNEIARIQAPARSILIDQLSEVPKKSDVELLAWGVLMSVRTWERLLEVRQSERKLRLVQGRRNVEASMAG